MSNRNLKTLPGEDIRMPGGGDHTDAVFTGDAGNNTINGTSSDDFFNMNDGGNDTVNGLGGNDVITFGGSFTAADTVNGGTGTDSVILSGDYSAGVTLASNTISSIEEIDLLNGNNYKLTTNDGNVAAGLSLFISAGGLDAAHTLNFNGAAESNGLLSVTSGAGSDALVFDGGGNTANTNGGNDIINVTGVVKGANTFNMGAGNDVVSFGATFNNQDAVDGGTGTDSVSLNGDYSAQTGLHANTLVNVETVQLAAGHSYWLVTDDGNVAAGQSMTIDGSALLVSDTLKAFADLETNGNLNIQGGAGNDDLRTGGGNDTVNGNGGNDFFAVGGGSDTINGGAGTDTINFNGGFDATDQVDGGTGTDVVNLFGNYSAGVTLGATTLQNIENLDLTGNFSYNLTFNDGNVTTGAFFAISDSISQTAANSIAIDATAESTAGYHINLGGPEHVSLDLGNGNDQIAMGKVSATDHIDGGGGFNTLTLKGGTAGLVTYGATSVENMFNIIFQGPGDFTVKMNDAAFSSLVFANFTDSQQMLASNTLTIDDSAETDAPVTFFIGGPENLVLTGGQLDDTFLVHGSLKATDKIDGGGGSNTVWLDGDYSAGLTLGATTLANIQDIMFSNGHSYHLVTNDANFASGQTVDVFAVNFTATDSLFFNGAAESDANFHMTAGDGNDTEIGGAGNDMLTSTGGVDAMQGNGGDDYISLLGTGALTFADGVNGGTGTDTLFISGNYAGGMILGSNIANVEILELGDQNVYNLTTTDALVAAGQNLQVSASDLTGGSNVIFDGSAETDGTFNIQTGAGNDLVTAGAGDDTISLLTGFDTAHGGGGDDVFYFFQQGFNTLDSLDGGAGTDTLLLFGNDVVNVAFTPTTLQNIEIIDVTEGFNYGFVTDDATVAAGETLTLLGQTLHGGDHLSFDGTAETDGLFVLYGGAGDDVFTGGALGDQLTGNAGNDQLYGMAGDDTISGGTGADYIDGGDGNDTIDVTQGTGTYAKGGNDDDTFVVGTAFYTGVLLEGGAGNDTAQVSGDYSAGLTFGPFNMLDVETLKVTDGTFSDSFTTVNDTVAAGSSLTVDGSAIQAGKSLTFNGAAETDGTFTVIGGFGDDTLTGGTQADTFRLSEGGNDKATGGQGNDLFDMGGALNAADQLNGGSNIDTVALAGNYAAGVTLGATTLTGIETMTFAARFSYKLTMDDGNVAAGKTLLMDGSALHPEDKLTLDGSAETNGHFTMLGGAGVDTLTGGALSDTFDLSTGNKDTANGGGGDDTFNFGAAFGAGDNVNGGTGNDTIVLNGDYSAQLNFGQITLANVETISLKDGFSYNLHPNDATVTAGQTLAIDGSHLGATSVLTFNGSAETDGSWNVTGGAADDIITGGDANDTLNGGGGADIIDASNGGNDTVFGAGGINTIKFGASFTAADSVDGGGNSNTVVQLAGDYSAGVVFGAATMQNVGIIKLAAGNSYTLTSNDTTVAAAKMLTVDGTSLTASDSLSFDGSAETNGVFTLNGGAGVDTLIGGAGIDHFRGGLGGDMLTGGGGADIFVYKLAGESTGAGYDTLTGFDFASDQIDVKKVTGIEATVSGGNLSAASMDADLGAAFDAAHLLGYHAALFNPTTGTLAGHTFLVVDANGTAGYQAGADYVFDVTGASNIGSLSTGDFV